MGRKRREWRRGVGCCECPDEVLGCMGNGVSWRDGRHGAVVWEKLGRPSDADALGLGDVKFVAAVVFHGRAHVPGFLAMGRPALACFGILEDECTGSRRGHGRFP